MTGTLPALAEACTHRPFSNGTEGQAWMSAWCDHCAKDHGMHGDDDTDGACDIILLSMLPDFPSDDFPWPEAWLPEPDDGAFTLPSRMVCGAFSACEPCGGDPGAEDRLERVIEVTAYWRDRSGHAGAHDASADQAGQSRSGTKAEQ